MILVQRGNDVFAHTSGMMDEQQTVPITPATRFRLASVQKVLTKVAVGQLADKGALSLDAPIGKYVRGIPPEMAAITIDQLLQHRSGVAGFLRMTPEAMTGLVSATSARDLLPLITSQPLEFRPGEREQYSNGGFWLLGVVIEAVSGKTYGEYLQDEVFRPLRMSATGLTVGPETAVRMTRMLPGQPPLATPHPVKMPMEPRGSPSGDGVSTADDLLRLGKALIGDSLVSAEIKARLFPKRPGEPWRLGQSGGNIGTNTDFAVYPESKVISVVLSNFDPPAGDLMGYVLRRVALGAGCAPLREEDHPGPRRLMPPPEPGPRLPTRSAS
ncbi:MAG TPA: serine hydrolase domain-containing protein [Allosphingosinicella sp.]